MRGPVIIESVQAVVEIGVGRRRGPSAAAVAIAAGQAGPGRIGWREDDGRTAAGRDRDRVAAVLGEHRPGNLGSREVGQDLVGVLAGKGHGRAPRIGVWREGGRRSWSACDCIAGDHRADQVVIRRPKSQPAVQIARCAQPVGDDRVGTAHGQRAFHRIIGRAGYGIPCEADLVRGYRTGTRRKRRRRPARPADVVKSGCA